MRKSILVLTLCALSFGALGVSAQDPSNGESSSASRQAPDAQPAPPASPAATETIPPAKKPHVKRVYTDDDFQNSFSRRAPKPEEVDISGVFQCDQSCFDDIIRGSVIPSGEYEKRNEIILQAIDNLKADPTWQETLHGYAHYRFFACQLEAEKLAALQAHSDPRTITREQLRIQDEYDRKDQDLRYRILSPLRKGRLDPAGATGKGFLRNAELRFAITQVGRILNSACPAPPEAAGTDTKTEADPPARENPEKP
jgi:hypothetical protein